MDSAKPKNLSVDGNEKIGFNAKSTIARGIRMFLGIIGGALVIGGCLATQTTRHRRKIANERKRAKQTGNWDAARIVQDAGGLSLWTRQLLYGTRGFLISALMIIGGTALMFKP